MGRGGPRTPAPVGARDRSLPFQSPPQLGIFFLFNTRNSYNRILRNCRGGETWLSGRGAVRAARRGVSPPPRPHRAEGLPEPHSHVPVGDRPSRSPPQPRQGSPSASAPAPGPAPPPLRTSGPARERERVRPGRREAPQLYRPGTGDGGGGGGGAGAAIPGSRGTGLRRGPPSGPPG